MSLSRRVYYRINQLWQGLHAQVAPQELAIAADILPAKAYERFRLQSVEAQRHCFDVYRMVHEAGWVNADLDAAALLHDVGKVAAQQGGVRLNLWTRSSLVLMHAVAPNLVKQMACDNPCTGWRYSAYVHLEHPAIGAEWALSDGCSSLTCWLIRHHQDTYAACDAPDAEDLRVRLLRALQTADNSF